MQWLARKPTKHFQSCTFFKLFVCSLSLSFMQRLVWPSYTLPHFNKRICTLPLLHNQQMASCALCWLCAAELFHLCLQVDQSAELWQPVWYWKFEFDVLPWGHLYQVGQQLVHIKFQCYLLPALCDGFTILWVVAHFLGLSATEMWRGSRCQHLTAL